MRRGVVGLTAMMVLGLLTGVGHAQGGGIQGRVTDETGGTLPGVTVEARLLSGGVPVVQVTGSMGEYALSDLPAGRYQLTFSLINFGQVTHRDIDVKTSAPTTVNQIMHLALNAEVTVVGKRTFANLADVENPAENLVGIAQAASQGAITAQQLDVRPLLRPGDVVETVPGMIADQHASGGKANQYFLRGFNLDHGTDFAQSILGMPVNMPTHAHGQGYTDINFLIPELVSGVQYSKGPYYADQGDFGTAGASNINYVTFLDRPLARVELGNQGFERAVFAASPAAGEGRLLLAFNGEHENGPWVTPDNYQKLNGVVRYSQGNSINSFALTAMGYHGQWHGTNQVPQRAIDEGLISQFGTLDPTDGGTTYRYSASADWQHGTPSTLTKVTAYGIGYDLRLFSNFTFYLNDPVRGDQEEQADHRFITGGKVVHQRETQWGGHTVKNTFGLQVRNDDITNVGRYLTEARVRFDTQSEAAVVETMGGAYVQNEIEWAPWLRSMAGLRVDAARFAVTDKLKAFDNDNGGTTSAGIVSPKGGLTLGPWRGTEFYVNAGEGFHSNDARGTTAKLDPLGNPTTTVSPLVKAKGAEFGVRTVVVPHLQTTVAVWMLRLDSELVFDGEALSTVPSPASKRSGVELANYYSPTKWLNFDLDASWSSARWTDFNPAGPYVPEAVGTVLSAGATVDNFHRTFGSLRWKYFGPRALIEDNSERSQATSLFELQGGYQLAKNLKVTAEVFNLFNSSVPDVTYYYTTRLRGEPLDGVDDYLVHVSPSRSARINLVVGFGGVKSPAPRGE